VKKKKVEWIVPFFFWSKKSLQRIWGFFLDRILCGEECAEKGLLDTPSFWRTLLGSYFLLLFLLRNVAKTILSTIDNMLDFFFECCV
jgi:hypothetical protein